jgi:RNA polymerase sigma factor (TIGR02999 family)
MNADTGEVTILLRELQGGRKDAAEKLVPLIYDELRKRAAAFMRRERSDHTLQATELVHEVYRRLVDNPANVHDRAHFFAIAARGMRRILVDHARARRAAKRGAGGHKVPVEDVTLVTPEQSIEVLALNTALDRLAEIDEQQSRIVELRYFGGLTEDETAEVLGVSSKTIQRDWKVAKAWLYGELTRSPEHEDSGVRSHSEDRENL